MRNHAQWKTIEMKLAELVALAKASQEDMLTEQLERLLVNLAEEKRVAESLARRIYK